MPTPTRSELDGLTVESLSLGAGSAPIDVAVAFGSVWIADHHSNSVTRLDPATMAVQATIRAGSGPGWFVSTKDALWVSNQNGVGLSRIDPTSNSATIQAGDWATCGKAVFAAGRIWQPACDAHRIMAIDPETHLAVDVDATAQWSLLAVGDELISGGPNGIARFDPRTLTFARIGGTDPGRLLAYDGTTLWGSDDRQVVRIRPRDGSVVATIPLAEAGTVALVGGAAWLATSGGLVEVDPTTNAIVRTLPIGPSVSVVASDGALWVTSFEQNIVTRIEVPG